jgi:S-DNA-T family DNA segregation ATPase FtsK/SpoIIIE
MPNLKPDSDLSDVKSNILRKLNGLGYRGITIGQEMTGPIITGYPLRLPHNIQVSKILNLTEDIALACDVESVDIQRLGNDVVVFIPNKERQVIKFYDVLFRYLKNKDIKNYRIPLMLGVDFLGNDAYLDLAEQPHILISGSTGSGKSVFEANLIAALSMLFEPNELQLYLVDTKMLDLTLFEDLPHVARVAKEITEWYSLSTELIAEVQRRNHLLNKNKVRNIKEYNEKVNESQRLSHIVLVIDELADLIMKDKAYRLESKSNLTVMGSIGMLIQICRAAGVHIIACTQRTSVDIVNGVVKSNFPTRISLKLPSKQDSRVILDSNGAENLLGKGDMLIKSNDSDSLSRYHGPYVGMNDIEMVLKQRDMILKSINTERLMLNS